MKVLLTTTFALGAIIVLGATQHAALASNQSENQLVKIRGGRAEMGGPRMGEGAPRGNEARRYEEEHRNWNNNAWEGAAIWGGGLGGYYTMPECEGPNCPVPTTED